MKTTYRWLKDFVDLECKPKTLAEVLTMSGTEVVGLERQGGDSVFDLEVTPNRPDCLSVIGIAREVAAVTGTRLNVPRPQLPKLPIASKRPTLHVTIKDPEACSQYRGVVIEGVHVGPSPVWLRKRLEILGMRSINNIVDVTNYVLMEYGQPLHAFDFDRIDGSEIVVRRAKKGESIRTLDEVERTLHEHDLVIADRSRAVAVAGVIGGMDTQVESTTTRVLLESAQFDPLMVRRAARRLGVGTESSYRFERGVDHVGVVTASDRAVELIVDVAGGQVTQCQLATAGRPQRQRSIRCHPKRMAETLGVAISLTRVKQLLTRLGCDVLTVQGGTLQVTPPSFRRDLTLEVDLNEEVARLIGFAEIPATLPRVSLDTHRTRRVEREHIRSMQGWLEGRGFQEIMTMNLLSHDEARTWHTQEQASDLLALRKPLTEEQECLAPSLLPGMLRVVAYNQRRGIEDIRCYEIGHVFQERKGQPDEHAMLGLVATGARRRSWDAAPEPTTFFDIKGDVEALCQRVGVKPSWSPGTDDSGVRAMMPGGSSQMLIGDRYMGRIGLVETSLAERYGLSDETWVAEIDLAVLCASAGSQVRYLAVSRLPAVYRDLAIVVADDVAAGDVEAIICSTGQPLLEAARLFDVYRGGQVGRGRKSLAYRLNFRSVERTLTDTEVDVVQATILRELAERLNATVRS